MFSEALAWAQKNFKGRHSARLRQHSCSYTDEQYSDMISEPLFTRLIHLERLRSERSRAPFVVVLVDITAAIPSSAGELKLISEVVSTLAESIRETDILGWHKEKSIIGVVFTQLNASDRHSMVDRILRRVTTALQTRLTLEVVSLFRLMFYCYPDDCEGSTGTEYPNILFYPELRERGEAKSGSRWVKRVLDIGGSLLVSVLLAPFFFAITLAIKLSSKGPVLYVQNRIGQCGRKFNLLKFRSMYVDTDASTHENYVTKLISGQVETGEGKLYKITDDPRVTPLGRFLRRSSLDELPQFLNVLKGEMSLVGPRPPLDYEVRAYDFWHRRRFLEARPGITGLWQVSGRSRTTFDEMVRLDLHYARHQSFWMDIKILLQTPRAVLSADGAY